MLIIEAGEFWSKELTQHYKYLCSWNVAYTTKEKWLSRFQDICNSYILSCCKRQNYISLQLGSVSSMFPRTLSVQLIKKTVVLLILTCTWTSRGEGRQICEFIFYPTLVFWTSRPPTSFFLTGIWLLATDLPISWIWQYKYSQVGCVWSSGWT